MASNRVRRLKNLNPVFHKRDKSEDNSELTYELMKQALKSGFLNLSGRGLATVPDKLWNIAEEVNPKELEFNLDNMEKKEEECWWNQKALTNLDLSSNVLTSISKRVSNLYDLTILDLHDNAIIKLPPEIGTLEKLTKINLSRNKLTTLPSEFFRLKELKILNLANNLLNDINPDVSDLYLLEVLDLSYNKLTTLPGGIGFLVRLTELNCSFNNIKELPDDFCNMRSLYKLDFMNNNLEYLPEDIGLMRKLKFLYAQHNDIKELPNFQGCDALEELHISNNFIKEIPSEFCENLPHLKILDLRDNKISELPEDISILQNLIRLDVSNNTLTTIPNSLSTLAHLISLQLNGNPIRTIRRDIINSGTQRILKFLRERAIQEDTAKMDIKSNFPIFGNIDVFPDKFKIRKNHCLTVTMKNLTEVPEEVFIDGKDEAVNMVDFSKNKFINIPQGLIHLSNCATEIIFSNNQLQTIPEFWPSFTRLSRIDFSSNYLCDLPKEFGSLKLLRELNISNNLFKFIPSPIYELTGLEILIARGNKIEKIDATSVGLGALKRLAILDLANNNIEQIPPILGNLKNITSLDLNGNPFRQPRQQILEKGTLTIMAYLRDRIPSTK
ncbi:leucine-rich repeat-containing protein 40 [Condylostylus longicornis]|uniref:leucine-rich repeat-containing protein 40 n=1 Tax=Condylostylus longicornis TaxID=2530218 RepID=UPI00244DD5FA|nr:leucine-rich repeat-containing protein 40 [Condylostylus longicornis]